MENKMMKFERASGPKVSDLTSEERRILRAGGAIHYRRDSGGRVVKTVEQAIERRAAQVPGASRAELIYIRTKLETDRATAARSRKLDTLDRRNGGR